MIYAFKTLDLEVKDVDRKQGIVSGYFSAFGVKDADGDIIHPGAFNKSIREWGPEGKGRIKHLMNHDPSKPLGKILELKEDDYGLFYRSQVGTHTLGRDFIKMVESDLVKEHSIGFNDLTPADRKKGEDANNITEVKLYEGSSLTGWGANEYTPLTEVKALSKDRIVERVKNIEKFVRNSDATDETIELLLLEYKQLAQLIETMSSTPAAVEAPEPQKQSKDAVDDNTIHSLQNIFSQWKTLKQ